MESVAQPRNDLNAVDPLLREQLSGGGGGRIAGASNNFNEAHACERSPPPPGVLLQCCNWIQRLRSLFSARGANSSLPLGSPPSRRGAAMPTLRI